MANIGLCPDCLGKIEAARAAMASWTDNPERDATTGWLENLLDEHFNKGLDLGLASAKDGPGTPS